MPEQVARGQGAGYNTQAADHYTELLLRRQTVMEEYIRVMDLMDEDITRRDQEHLGIHSTAESELLRQLNNLQRVITAFRKDRSVSKHSSFTSGAPTAHGTSGTHSAHGTSGTHSASVSEELEERFTELNETAVQKILRNRSRLEHALRSTEGELSRVKRARARTGRKYTPARSLYIDIET